MVTVSCVLSLVLPLAASVQGQTQRSDTPAADSLRQRQLVQLSPHVIWLSPQSTTATLTFRNESDSVKRAQVVVQFAYWDYRHGFPYDTLVINTKEVPLGPRDTVVAHPDHNAPYAGRWLSGLPDTVTLPPHQTKQVTVRLTPPADLAPGEYWARIATLVRPTKRHPGGQDTRKQYALPTQGRALLLRDTCLVVYRTGTVRMGLAIDSGATARIDSANVGVGVNPQHFSHALWVRLPLHLTGNAPFRGMMHSAYRNVETGEIVNPNRLAFTLMKDAVFHPVIETDVLTPGEWEYTVWFDNADPGIPKDKWLPLAQPVKHTFRFQILSAWQY
jgi:hypothetical protein